MRISVIGIFHWHNPPDRTMTLGSTQPLTENEYQENFLGVNAAGAYGWQPYHLPVPLSWNLGTLTSWYPLGHSRPVTGLIYLYRMKISVFWEWPCADWYRIANFWRNLRYPFTRQIVILSIMNTEAVGYSTKIGGFLPEYTTSLFRRESTS